MNKAEISVQKVKFNSILDSGFKEQNEYLQPRYEIISQIIEARKKQELSQAELAKRIGTQKSNISRLESGNYNPSLDFLIKVAQCLGKDLKIQLK